MVVKKAKGSVGKLTPAQFEAAVSAGESFPCVLLMGEEDYLRQQAEQAYLDKLLPLECRDFNLERLSGQTLDVPKLQGALTRLPFASPHCVLQIDDPSKLNSKAMKVLKDYLEVPSSSLRILLEESRNLEKKAGDDPLAGFLDFVVYVEYRKLKRENQRMDWVINYVQGKGKKITNEAAQYLVQISTDSLYELISKLDHAIIFVGGAPEVDVFTIQRISGITSELTIFQLEDALLRRSLDNCLRISRRLLEGGAQVLQLINYLHRTLMRVWQMKARLRERDREKVYKEILGGQKWKGRDFEQASRSMPVAMIERGLLGLLDLEITLKTRVVQEDVLFYHWLCDVLTHGQATTEPKVALES